MTYFDDLVSHLSPILAGLDIRATTESLRNLHLPLNLSNRTASWVSKPRSATKCFIRLASGAICLAKEQRHSNKINRIKEPTNSFICLIHYEPIKRRANGIGPITHQIAHIFKNKLGLQSSSKNIDLCLPEQWAPEAHQSRVMRHPESSSSGKNWKASSYLILARRLQ